MPFDLRVSFSGLAMYVTRDGGQVEVLLPSVPGPAAPHGVRIEYDAAYETPGSTRLSGERRVVDLDARVLDLTGLSARDDSAPRLPEELPRLTDPAGRVSAPLPGTPLDQTLAARVTMDAGRFQRHTPPMFSLPGGPSRDGQIRMEWTIEGITVDGDEDAVLPGRALLGPDGTPRERLPDLFPIGETIHLTVFNADPEPVPRPEIAPDADVSPRQHFAAFYPPGSPPRQP
jgi:hypothetical protein